MRTPADVLIFGLQVMHYVLTWNLKILVQVGGTGSTGKLDPGSEGQNHLGKFWS